MNKKYIIGIIIIALCVGGGILWYAKYINDDIEVLNQVPDIKIPEKDKKEIAGTNIPGTWVNPTVEGAELIFHNNGLVKIPEFIGGNNPKSVLNWQYDKNSNILTIDFKSVPNLFPGDNKTAQDYFGDTGNDPRKSSFVEYNKQDFSVGIKVTSETVALNFFGWIFFRDLSIFSN